MKWNWREQAQAAWKDPVGSKVIANLIWAVLVGAALLVVAFAQGWIFKESPKPENASVTNGKTPQTTPSGRPVEAGREPAPQVKSAESASGGGGQLAETPSPFITAGPKPEPPPPVPTLFVDCRIGTLPKTVPASGRIYALVPQPLPQEDGGGGLIEYFGQPGSEWSWGKVPDLVYRCDLINYANALVVDLDMDFAYEMRVPIPVPDQPKALKQGEVALSRTWPIRIAKVDVGIGSPFVFYLHNCCQDRFVYFRAPAIARATLDGARVEFRVRQSENNLSQPLMPARPNEK